MSSFDEDIKRSVWEGKIPIVFTLSPDDLTSHLSSPSPYTIMAPRNSYFPLITNLVKDYFSSSTLVLLDEMWLEYKGIPLKWHIPIGVLYDTLVSGNGGNNNSNNNNNNKNNNNNNNGFEQPYWSIVVHFQSYPDRILLRCPNIDSVKTYYKNVLKEANFIKQGDITKYNNLNINQSNDLWDGLKSHDYDKFWSVNKKFIPNTVKEYKNIPIRLIINYKPPIQELIPVFDENSNVELTLESLFSKIPFESFKDYLNYNSNYNNNSNNNSPPLSPNSNVDNSNSSSSNVDNSIENSLNQTNLSSNQPEFSNLLQFIKSSNAEYKIQGIEPSLKSSAIWLYEHFGHPDNFLYITLIDPAFKNNNNNNNNNQI